MKRLLDALATGWRISTSHPPFVIAPLEGGAAAFVIGVPVATVAGGDAASSLLERLQARRSRLLYALDRKTAVALALRWRLDLARIRIFAGGPPPEELVRRELLAHARKVGSWHST